MKLCLLLLLVLFSVHSLPGAESDNWPVFSWANRPRLNAEQLALLRLYKKLAAATVPAEQARIESEVQTARKALGAAAVRLVSETEPTFSQFVGTDVFAIYNTSDENVALWISRSDDKSGLISWSVDSPNTFYLPPHGTLIVTGMTGCYRGLDLPKPAPAK